MSDERRIGRRGFVAGAAGAVGLAVTGRVAAATAPDGLAVGAPGPLEAVLAMRAPATPTGFAIAPDGRPFAFMPRLDDRTPFGVGVVGPGGAVTPFPSLAMNRPDPARPQDTLFHVPNGVFDGRGRLWVLDAGILAAAGAPVAGAAKLVCFDATTGAVLRTVPLGPVVAPTSSLNDLRVYAGRGGREAAYVTDQGQDGQGAIIAVDLASGRAVRRLGRHSSTASQRHVFKLVEGQRILRRGRDGTTSEVQGGANGIALGPDGRRLYYAPLMGRRLYAVDTDALLDPDANDAAVAATVRDLGEKGFTGGLTTDDRDRVYLTLQEHNAVARRHPDGTIEVLGSDPRLIWPDTLWITPDRWLYVSASQVNRRPEYTGGADAQRPPYHVFRVRIDAGPA